MSQASESSLKLTFYFLFNDQKFNNEWWIGRPVKEDGVVGFIPSPVNLETILIRREVQARKAAKALARYVQHVSLFHQLQRNRVANSHTGPCCSALPYLVILIIIFIGPAHIQTKHQCKVKYRGLYDILGIRLMLFENIQRLVKLHFDQRGVISVKGSHRELFCR